jgi:hypothetical protein
MFEAVATCKHCRSNRPTNEPGADGNGENVALVRSELVAGLGGGGQCPPGVAQGRLRRANPWDRFLGLESWQYFPLIFGLYAPDSPIKPGE